MAWKKSVRLILLVGALLTALTSFSVHPFGPVKKQASNKPLLVGTDADPGVVHILEHSCQNCHSETTDWPWYSYIAPVSWMVERDVTEARDHMNLSRWDEYSAPRQRWVLAGIAAVIRGRQMPPRRYTLLHPAARLSDEHRDELYQWAASERQRLTGAPEARTHSRKPERVP